MPTREDATPESIGPYRILDTLGEGGMGTVYRAEQREPVKRQVALKLIKLGMDSKEIVRRFEQERQALALMDHEGIAKVFDCGTSERGQPFFVMELVKGVPLDQFCEQNQLSLNDRLVLMQQVCAAVQHAHQKGVVHRDLKPGNVLVSSDAGRWQVKIIDFGLAKAMGQKLVEATLFTEAGQIVGTPEYMAPEQADPSNEDIDTRADIYSLGVMLYQVLIAQLPFPAADLRRAGMLEVQRMLREDDPPKPSTRLTTIGDAGTELAKARRVSLGALKRALQTDLDWVVLKALEKDRNRRYDTANALSADLQRYLQHEPLVAGPPSASYRLQKLLRRYRSQVVAGGLVFVALLAGGVGTSVQWLRAEEQAEENRRLLVRETKAKDEKARLALENGQLANEKGQLLSEFEQVKGVPRYEDVMSGVKALLEQPAWPAAIPAMESWLADCDELLAMRGEIERTIQRLREDALPWTAELEAAFELSDPGAHAEWLLLGRRLASLRHAQSIRDGASLPEVALSAEQQSLDATALNTLAWERVDPESSKRKVWGEEPLALAAARLAVEKSTDDPAKFQFLDTLAWALLANGQDDEAKAVSQEALDAAPADEKQAYEGYLASITGAIDRADELLAKAIEAYEERPIWEFAAEDEAQGFLHDTLVGLQGKLDRLESEQRRVIAQRLEWSQRIETLSLAHPNARVTWGAVREAIAESDKYEGQTVELFDQDVLGLVPLGPNPVTGYFEFYHLRSAWDGTSDPAEIPIPQHDPEDGSIEVNGDTGIVFVLLPGGTATLGSQSENEDAPNFDAQRGSDETLHTVTLEPFFLARHELTQGQWARLWRGDASLRDPSQYKSGTTPGGVRRITLHNPVDQVDWEMSRDLLAAQGLLLPTEAQWEYGCRGGTTSVWNVPLSDLQKVANVADATAKPLAPWTCEEWSDGHVVHAPVGSFLPNGFGLYDMHGNVWEWCRDSYGAYGSERPGDALNAVSGSSYRVIRGGSFLSTAVFARSAYRYGNAPSIRNDSLGLRPARASRLED